MLKDTDLFPLENARISFVLFSSFLFIFFIPCFKNEQKFKKKKKKKKGEETVVLSLVSTSRWYPSGLV